MKSRRAAWTALSTLLTSASVSMADTPPTVWDIAAAPAKRTANELHIRVERLLHPTELGSGATDVILDPTRARELRLEAARAMLEGATEEQAVDVRVRIDLGMVYEALAAITEREDLYRKAVEVLSPALSDAANDGGYPNALESLAWAYGWLDRPRDEIPIWRRFLDRVTDDRRRPEALADLGEALMQEGMLRDAVTAFREAIDVCETLAGSAPLDLEYALATWDLAVAIDRIGDAVTAQSIARRAKHWTWLEGAPGGMVRSVTGWDVIRNVVGVYFRPEWERQWYLAMGEAAEAQTESDPRTALKSWAAAEEHWNAYVTGAESSESGDRWLPIARIRLERVRAEHAELERRTRASVVRKSADAGSSSP